MPHDGRKFDVMRRTEFLRRNQRWGDEKLEARFNGGRLERGCEQHFSQRAKRAKSVRRRLFAQTATGG
jgi:hypothetical protein